MAARFWWSKLWGTRRPLSGLPTGLDVELPWHLPLAEAERALTAAGALALDPEGLPTARLRWGDWSLRASLEFVDGVAIDARTWLPDHPHAKFTRRGPGEGRMLPRLRAAMVPLPAVHRENWKRTVELLGRPAGKGEDGTWTWSFPEMAVSFLGGGAESVDTLRFAATAASRVVEVRNQTPLDLFTQLRVRVDFRAGSWEMGEAPRMLGVPVRLHWDTPADEPLLVTATTSDREAAVEVGPGATRILLASDGRGGVRILG